MAFSKVSICNDAADHLGQPPLVIDADADHQEHATAASIVRNYDVALAACLEDHPWTFAKRRVLIEAAGAAPSFGWTYAYALPQSADAPPLACVRVWKVAPDADGETQPFEVEGGFILTNEAAPLPVEFVARIEDASKFSAKFAEALAWKIASMSCLKVLGSLGEQPALDRQYERCKVDAAAVSSQQKPQPVAYGGSWLDGRGTA